MKALTPLSLLLFLVLLLLLPLLFTELMAASLVKLHLSGGVAVALTLLIIFGGMVNIPLRRIPHSYAVPRHPLAVLGLDDWLPDLRRTRRETVIAVNLGGCIVPAAIALYEFAHMFPRGEAAVIMTVVACAINIVLCYALARPVRGVGILLPSLVPALGAALLGLVLQPHDAAPVAFIAGVAGPLIGADFLHLKDVSAATTGIASIGGAGTFDGIVLSGIIAAYLA